MSGTSGEDHCWCLFVIPPWNTFKTKLDNGSSSHNAQASLTANTGGLLCRRSYRKNEVIEENKALLKEKYTAAKALGKQVRHLTPARMHHLPLFTLQHVTCIAGLTNMVK